jgi:hypothetical protein
MKVKLFGASSSQGQDFRELVFDSDENSAQFLHQAVSDLFNLAPNEFVLVSTAGVKVDLGSNIRNGQTLRICPTVRGGKVSFRHGLKTSNLHVLSVRNFIVISVRLSVRHYMFVIICSSFLFLVS